MCRGVAALRPCQTVRRGIAKSGGGRRRPLVAINLEKPETYGTEFAPPNEPFEKWKPYAEAARSIVGCGRKSRFKLQRRCDRRG